MTDAQPTPQPPKSLGDKLLFFIGSLGYLGYAPASGTVAVAVVGVPLHLLLVGALHLSTAMYVGAVTLLTFVAVYVSAQVDRMVGEKDSSRGVIDELPGYLIALAGLPLSWQIIVAAFFLERFIDIAKIWPANYIEKHWPGGWGVVFDDVVAGLYTLLILHVAIWAFPHWLGM